MAELNNANAQPDPGDSLSSLDPLSEVGADHRSGFVAVVGRPNVGKSTLMNQMLGQKVAIVSPRPQTTRNRITGILTTDDMQIIFVDTPGIHQPQHKLGEFMVEEAQSSMPDADLVLWVTDISRRPHADDERVATVLQTLPLPIILVMNKIDIVSPEQLLTHSESYRALAPDSAIDIAISARQGLGVDALQELIFAHLSPGPRFYPRDQITDIQERFLVAELVREQALLRLRQEVPHAVAVDVESFSERPDGMVYIAARVFVEHDSQKGILLGKGGSMLKRIGSDARREIERELEISVYLDLRVTVKPGWRRNPAELRRLGYG